VPRYVTERKVLHFLPSPKMPTLLRLNTFECLAFVAQRGTPLGKSFSLLLSQLDATVL